MNTRRATHTALLAMLLAGSAAAQSGAAIDGAGFPDPEEKPQRTEQPRDDMGREEGAVAAPQERTSEIEAPAAEPERPRKRRWWRRDGPLTPEERMDRMERESRRQERQMERRQQRTQPDSGGEPMGPTTTTPGENDTRR